ncbi:hypothetical protein ACFL02_02595 [Planctomycetota bacterium]
MVDESSENSKKPTPKDPEGHGSESGPNQSDSNGVPSEPTGDDIDSLLMSATDALNEVDSRLGEAEVDAEAETGDNAERSDETKAQEIVLQETAATGSDQSEVAQVEQTLADVQQEMGVISQEVKTDQSAASDTIATDESQNSLAKKENVTETTADDTLNSPTDEENDSVSLETSQASSAEKEEEENVDDVLSALADEITDVSDGQEQSPAVSDDQPSEVSSKKEEEENVDDVLSALADELTETTDSDDASPLTGENQPEEMESSAVTDDDKQAAGEEIDAVFSELEQDIQGASERGKSTEPPAEESEGKAAPTAETIPEKSVPASSAPATETPAEQSAAGAEEEKIVADELAGKQAETAPPLEEDTESPQETDEDYGHFPLPVRLLIKVMAVFNRPFFFVPEPAKDILGLIGIITCIVAILAIALILLSN